MIFWATDSSLDMFFFQNLDFKVQAEIGTIGIRSDGAGNNPPEFGSDRWGNCEEMVDSCDFCAAAG